MPPPPSSPPSVPPKPGKGTVVPPGDFWAANWDKRGAERDAAAMAYVQHHNTQADWEVVTSSDNKGRTLRVPVMSDALRIEGVRFPLSGLNQQLLANARNEVLLTSYVAGLISAQSDVQIAPVTLMRGDGTIRTDIGLPYPPGTKGSLVMNDSPTCVAISQAIDREIGFQSGMLNNPGKAVVLTRRLWASGTNKMGLPYNQTVAIVGFWTAPWSPIQPLSLYHGINYEDYSHPYRAMGPTCELHEPGEEPGTFQTATIMTNPELGPLLCGVAGKVYGKVVGEGFLPAAHHPGVS